MTALIYSRFFIDALLVLDLEHDQRIVLSHPAAHSYLRIERPRSITHERLSAQLIGKRADQPLGFRRCFANNLRGGKNFVNESDGLPGEKGH